MTPERWEQIERIFEEALRQPVEHRAAYLDEACGEDEQLRTEVVSLLKEHEAEPDFLEQPLITEAGEMSEAATLGPYRLIKPLGRGGMGSVYLARRADGTFRQEVALKVIRRGLDTEDFLVRFRAERQILASLNHPNIARIYDGGATPDGRPYFVMEYIDGLPITTYCDRHRLSIEKRLELFRAVGAAVQHAHQNLVVHRDLKPSNILVTADGTPKLLDFGIAKLLDAEQAGLSHPVTRTDLRLMTPEYASPEQVSGEHITTSSDVYALGVLLYELLTGRKPYQLPKRLHHEIQRVILQEEPTRPSTAVTKTEDAADTISRARGTQVHRLRRRLAGDLDNVVLMAMRKEPERRYASAQQFCEDVRRHLEGLPVIARADSRAYRMQKFVRRHRFGVASAVTIAGLLIAATTGMALQSAEIRERSIEVALERDRAEQVVDFLVDVFSTSYPNASRGETVTARELLDRGTQQVEAELQGQPETQARMMAVMGRVYESLGLYEPATSLARRVVELRRQVFGERHAEYASALNNLGAVLQRVAHYDEAEALHRQALQIRRELPAPDTVIAGSLINLATLLKDRGQLQEAEEKVREALRIERTAGSRSSVARALSNLGSLLSTQGRYDEAEEALREAVAIRRTMPDQGNLSLVSPVNNLAALLIRRADHAGAEPLLREALQLSRARLGNEHPDVATVVGNLAAVLAELGEYDQADSLYREALEMQRRLTGEEHPDVALHLNNIGTLLRKKGDYSEAEMYFREALTLQRRVMGDEHPHTASYRHNLAVALREQGHLGEAETEFRTSLATFEQLLGAAHPNVAIVRTSLAEVLQERRHPAAEAEFKFAVDALRAGLQAGHPRTATALLGLGQTILDARPEEAHAYLLEAFEIRREKLGAEDWQTAEAEVALGSALLLLGRQEEARPLLQHGHDVLVATWEASDRRVRAAREALRRLSDVIRNEASPRD